MRSSLARAAAFSFAALTAFASFALPLAAQAPATQPLAFVGGTVLVGDGSPAIADGVVVVAAGRITAVGARSAVTIPANARTIDCAGKFVTPGLIDTHVHYSQTGWADGRPDARDVRKQFPYERTMAENAAHPERFHLAFLLAGVTAVFDVGGYPWTRTLGAATESSPWAPHVVAAGPLLATYDPKVLTLPDQVQFVFPKSEDEARAFVRSHHAFGSQAIKVWLIPTPERPLEQLAPIVRAAGDEAKQLGLPLIVHATELEAARVAVLAGASLLVHSVENAPVDDAFVQAAKAQGTFYCPTLTVRDGYAQLYAAKVSDEVKHQLADVHPSIADRVRRTEQIDDTQRRPARVLEGMNKRFALQRETMAKNLVRLHDAGVPIVMGTDAGNPLTLHGPSVFVEMEAMQAAGMKAGDVLVAATSAAAKALGRGNDLGRVATGCVADLLVLAQDPAADARAFRSVEQVCRAGVLHTRAQLHERLFAARPASELHGTMPFVFTLFADDAEVRHRVLLQGNGKLAALDANGAIEWEMPWGGVHDLHRLANGHILTQRDMHEVVEIDPATKQVAWSYDAATQNGNAGKRIEVHALQPLADGRVLIAESGPARLIEIDRAGKILATVPLTVEHKDPHRDTRLVRKLDSGNYLVCHEGDGCVREYDGAGKVVWSFAVPLFDKQPKPGHGPEAFGNQVFAAVRLADGNTLIATGNGHSVLRVDPAGKIVWQLQQDDLPGIRLAWVTTIAVLPNGNYVLGNCHAGAGQPVLIEIEPDTKRVVWKLDAFDRFGNDVSTSLLLDVDARR